MYQAGYRNFFQSLQDVKKGFGTATLLRLFLPVLRIRSIVDLKIGLAFLIVWAGANRNFL